MSRLAPTTEINRPRGFDIFLLIGGIFVFFFGLMVGRLTERAWRLHLNAERYIKTELEILHLDDTPGEGGPGAHVVRVAATGEEIIVHDLDTRITTKHGPGGVIGTLPTATAVQGMRMPAWYTPNAGGVFSDLRVAYLSEYDSLPGKAHAIKVTLVNLAFLVAGAATIRTGYWRLKKSVDGKKCRESKTDPGSVVLPYRDHIVSRRTQRHAGRRRLTLFVVRF